MCLWFVVSLICHLLRWVKVIHVNTWSVVEWKLRLNAKNKAAQREKLNKTTTITIACIVGAWKRRKKVPFSVCIYVYVWVALEQIHYICVEVSQTLYIIHICTCRRATAAVYLARSAFVCSSLIWQRCLLLCLTSCTMKIQAKQQ